MWKAWITLPATATSLHKKTGCKHNQKAAFKRFKANIAECKNPCVFGFYKGIIILPIWYNPTQSYWITISKLSSTQACHCKTSSWPSLVVHHTNKIVNLHDFHEKIWQISWDSLEKHDNFPGFPLKKRLLFGLVSSQNFPHPPFRRVGWITYRWENGTDTEPRHRNEEAIRAFFADAAWPPIPKEKMVWGGEEVCINSYLYLHLVDVGKYPKNPREKNPPENSPDRILPIYHDSVPISQFWNMVW